MRLALTTAAVMLLARPLGAAERTTTDSVLDALIRKSTQLLESELKSPPADLTIAVTASGCRWRFGYATPSGAATYEPAPCASKLCALGVDTDRAPRIPVGRTVHLVMKADSPGRHLFAVPTLGLKIEAEAGKTRESWVKALRTGVFVGFPSPGCETNPSTNPTSLRADEPRDFEMWLSRLPAAVHPGSKAEPKL